MKIAIIQRFLPSCSRGGVGYFTHGLSNALVKEGHEVTVFSEDSLPEGATYQVVIVPGKKSPLSFPFRIAKQDFSGFDVVHAQGDDQWIKRPKGVAWVRTMHGSGLMEAYYNGLKRKSLKHFLMHLYFYLCETISSLRAGYIATVSEQTKKFYFKADSAIPNGIDVSSFLASAEEKTEYPSILFVGELKTRKRGALLLQKFREEIHPKIPTAQLFLVCPEEVSGPGVIWCGRVSNEELIKLYAKAWVFCLPSDYEGFGRPYLEAMAAGTPVVATYNHGAREILMKDQYGIEVADSKLGLTLVQLLKDSNRRDYYREKGLERVCSYDWKIVAASYAGIYQSLKGNNA